MQDTEIKNGMVRMPEEIRAKIFRYISTFRLCDKFLCSDNKYIREFGEQNATVLHGLNSINTFDDLVTLKLFRLKHVEPVIFICGYYLHVTLMDKMKNISCILVNNSDEVDWINCNDFYIFIDSYLRFKHKAPIAYCLLNREFPDSDEAFYKGGIFDYIVVAVGDNIYIPKMCSRLIKTILSLHPNAKIKIESSLSNIKSEDVRLVAKKFGF